MRTNQTLKTYLDLEDESDVEDESEDEEFLDMTPCPKKRNATESRDSKEDRYEEIEVTQEMVDAAKSQSQIGDSVVLMEEINNLLNPTSTPPSGKLQVQNENELVFIIQNVGDTSESTHLIQTNQLQEEKPPIGTSKDNFKCTTCEMIFVRKKNFDNHMKRFHENEDEGGPPEKKRLRLKLTHESNKEELKKNLEENPEAKRKLFLCFIKKSVNNIQTTEKAFIFTLAYYLQQFAGRSLPYKPFIMYYLIFIGCKTCGALYMNEKSLKLHERRNACQQESYQCNVCSKMFTDQKVFTAHTQNHPQQQLPEETFDPDRKFPCTVCPRAFKMLSTLKDHLRTHTGDKPFICTICGRGFSQNTNLKQHLRRHTQVKPFRCDHETCSASFVSKGELDSHSRTHTGAHPFSCDQCGTGFTTSSSLLKHKRIHSGEVTECVCLFC